MAQTLVRSRADATIIALVDTVKNVGVKLKTSDVPYPGEHGVGSVFRYAERLWTPCDLDDQQAKDALVTFSALAAMPVS